mmetsp:Transcript_118819/g.236713  ORF Transcript_118819/g.236713 Transcript_118819/m.236713 type:complete len:587 (+) Transcript_118819:86-1846(+)
MGRYITVAVEDPIDNRQRRRRVLHLFGVVTLVSAAAVGRRLWGRQPPPHAAEQRLIGALAVEGKKQEQQLCCSGSTAGAGCHEGCSTNPSANLWHCSDRRNFAETGCGNHCGLKEDNYDYFGGDLYSVEDIASESGCCALCRAEPNCTMWTWGKNTSRVEHARNRCYLKHQLELKRAAHSTSVSGFPGKSMLRFEIKSRHGLCLDFRGTEVFLAECRASEGVQSQQWWIDLSKGMIMTLSGLCMGSPDWKLEGGVVHLRHCSEKFSVLGQHWLFDTHVGFIRNRAGFCVEALHRSADGSGLQMSSCNTSRFDQQWSMWFTNALDEEQTAEAMALEATTRTTTMFAKSGTSLYCYSLMLPYGVEVSLLRNQAEHGTGIFACEETTAFSSQSVKLSAKFYTEPLYNTSLHCRRGGRWGTYLNTPIFTKIWMKIVYDGRYKFHDWVVKVDPDTVFFANRLRDILREPEFNESEIHNGAILHNCGHGLHGPIEVLSRRAMQVFGENLWNCEQKPQEDWFLSLCLDKLQARVHYRDDLLAESSCFLMGKGRKDPNWQSCYTAHASFHPFKTPEQYMECHAHAQASASGMAI